MANSPLLVPGSAEASTVNRKKLSNPSAASNGATPEAANTSNGAVHDLAEQMNEEEKHKYVKGPVLLHIPRPSANLS
jgi:cyclin-dependent kinase 7